MRPTDIKLTEAHAIILADLQRAGVTDIVGEMPYEWFTEEPAATPHPVAEKLQEKQPIQVKRQEAKPKPKAQPAAVEVKLPKADTCLHLSGEPNQILIVTGAFYNKLAQPFTADEHTLLTNMLLAIDVDMKQTGILSCGVADEHGSPYPDDFKQKLQPLVQTKVQQIAPPAVLVLGQVTAFLMTGETQPLSPAREAAQTGKWDTHAPCAITYHPRHLLKQPLLKRSAWQDLCAFQSRRLKKEAA